MRRKRWVYPVLMATCVVVFWWFENFYRTDPYGSGTAPEPAGSFPEAFRPEGGGGQLVEHDFYLLRYSEPHEQAAWVGYVLERDHLTYEDRDRPYFVEDPKVRSHSADWRNYRGSGYDRGHLCPAGDRRFSLTAYNQTFYTSNISPQDPEFNAGPWNDLEQQVRRWCKRYGTVYVLTGGVLRDGLPGIGSEDVSVPDQFFKVVIRGSGNDLKAIGFLMENRPGAQPLPEHAIPLDRIEALTGLDFFPQWEPGQQEMLEARISLSDWGF
ncbi:DNA/RNA non-specific endonuclease [Robiginitalea sp. M366]|uniref:DNA/RNA non-specific endonuclease n=1 Tax=Robiginitalea aestuariiviva TaxID=3036903 RepID=UPI00240E0E22|nr:DNA/RNA non-specific endonuclease [Robiginitalea aestuariiviva]MDG1571886.1 DNA/RNA non-specific endonuclease [Robiginitalea aestuariiviva]